MKKIFCYVASLLVAAGAMIGCTEDITTDNLLPNEDLNNVEFIEVTADLEIQESRTTLTDGGNGGKVVWSEGDTIGAIAVDGTVTHSEQKRFLHIYLTAAEVVVHYLQPHLKLREMFM